MNKRLKSLDIARASTFPGSKAPSRHRESTAQPIDRPKTPRLGSARYTRQGVQSLKQQQGYRVRNSLADLVSKELDDFDRCTFYQRVFILAKNIIMTESIDSSLTSILDKYMQSRTSAQDYVQLEEEQSEEHIDEERESEVAEEEIEQKIEAESRISATESLREDNLLQITKSDLQVAYKEKRYRELDFFEFFRGRVEKIVRKCEYEQLSDDRLTGLLLCLGNSHTLIVLEGTEDSIATFCQELLKTCRDCLDVARIFLVEDRIEETYFDTFVYRRSVAMNINEKFPPPTANDPQLMASQHWYIKEKLRTLCKTLSEELIPKVTEFTPRMTELRLVTVTADEVVEERPAKKRKPKHHRKKSPKRAKSPTTIVEEAEKEEEEEEMSVRGTIGSIRFKPIDTETILPQKPEEQNAEKRLSEKESEIQTMRKDSIRSRLDSIVDDRKSAITPMEELVEEKDEGPDEPLEPFALHPSTYIRLLPEVQRIELVLTSKRFYVDLEEFIRFSNQIPMQEDEDAMIWPTSFSYLPLSIFDRLPFDVNLTFGNYDANEANEEETTTSEDEK